MLVQNPNIELVIAVLNGLNVDGETMQHIIEQVGMTDQMKSQLGASSGNPKELILTPLEHESLVNDITNSIEDDIDSIIDVEFSLSGNYIEVDSHNIDNRRLTNIIESALENYVTVQEPANAL